MAAWAGNWIPKQHTLFAAVWAAFEFMQQISAEKKYVKKAEFAPGEGKKKSGGVPDAVFMISTPPLHAEMEIKKNEIVGK